LILIYVVTASSFWMQAEMCAMAGLTGAAKKMSGELPQTVQKWIEIEGREDRGNAAVLVQIAMLNPHLKMNAPFMVIFTN